MLYPHPPEYIDYPTSDGEPMGETDLHRELMMELISALQIHFQDQADIYASGNILMLYEEGNRNAHVSPDVLIALGVPQRKRENYKIWEEGKAPDLVIEVTSTSTRMRDVGFKKGLYEALGVREYLLFDPRKEYLKPRFQVYRLEGDLYVRVLTPESTGYVSESTGLEFRVVDDKLRVLIAHGGPMLPTPSEHAARAEQEAARADALERELAALKAAGRLSNPSPPDTD
ncbi:MAG: Uma2 family endonuclease [Nitrospirales bacterium]